MAADGLKWGQRMEGMSYILLLLLGRLLFRCCLLLWRCLLFCRLLWRGLLLGRSLFLGGGLLWCRLLCSLYQLKRLPDLNELSGIDRPLERKVEPSSWDIFKRSLLIVR